MNIQLIHRDDFSEEHYQSHKILPLVEDLDIPWSVTRDEIILTLVQTNTRDLKRPMEIAKTPVIRLKDGVEVREDQGPIERIEKYICPRDKMVTLSGYWRIQEKQKSVVDGEDGKKHEEITYPASWFVLEGPGEGSRLAFRIQTVDDVRVLNWFPRDQKTRFNVKWTGPRELKAIVVGKVVSGFNPLDDEIIKLGALDDDQLETLCGVNKVDWDLGKISRETSVKKLAEKTLAKRSKAVKKVEPEPVQA